ncbi:hypothetical protein [Halomicrococcus gelatinilyticus]|uniref:hypothetical protein n=1 Tax=Halomicrococcus gelatinilyticus TaxID=1702103 RepID=UPI002E0D8D12
MASRGVSGLVLTKRGVIVLLVASAGVLGAGVGYVFPVLTDSTDVPAGAGPPSSGPTGTTSDPTTTASERATTRQSPGETTRASERGDDGTAVVTPTATTTTADASDGTSDDENWWYETDDDSEPSDGTDEDAAVGIHAEVNATVASLTDSTRPAVGG